jgi:hypothetical protein
MAAARLIEVMVSSRNRTALTGGGDLTALRREVKERLQSVLARPDGEPRLSVWVNEDSEALPAESDWYDRSTERARDATIVLVLFSGEAGTVIPGRGVGVCHAELEEALADTRTKVRIVDIRPLVQSPPRPTKADNAFTASVDGLRSLTSSARTRAEAVEAAVDAVGDALHALALAGVGSSRRGRHSQGAALDWRRLTFAGRKAAMEEAVVAALVAATGGQGHREPGANRPAVHVELGGQRVLMVAHGAPEGLSLAASRELVGQLHRHDHLLAGALGGSIGPVHVLACPAGVTANQMRSLMGASELVLATTPAGVWAADTVSRAQVLAVRDCIDAATTGLQVDEALAWLRQSGEDAELAARAHRRRAIIEQVAAPDHP